MPNVTFTFTSSYTKFCSEMAYLKADDLMDIRDQDNI